MNITCYDIDGNLLKTLTQWDINQKIVINNLSLTNTPEVHFCNPHSELALVGESTYSDGTLTTEVPNILLQENLPIIVYIYVPKGDGSAKTTYSIRIPVNPRPKPADYEYSDNAHFITYEELQAALANSVEVIELANAAADRANEAASVAETSMEYCKNNFANAVKGTAHADCGEYIYVDDISPIEHEMEVLLTQKNLLRLGTSNYVPGRSQTISGVTFTVNEDGSVTANGTATGGASFAIKPNNGEYKTGSKTVALSGCPAGGSATTYCMRLKNQASAYGNYDEYGDGKIINDVDMDGSYISCVVFGGTTVENLVFHPQLEYGDEITDYEPSVDLSTVNVTACGKNLFDYDNVSFESSVCEKKDNKYIINNTNNSVAVYVSSTDISALHLKPNTTYISKAIVTQDKVVEGGGSAGSMSLSLLLQTTNNFNQDTDNPKIYIINGYVSATTSGNAEGTFELLTTFTTPVDLSPYVYLVGRVSGGVIVTFENIQIEEGNISTEYEPFKGDSYTPNVDGTCDVKSVSPFMQIFTDNEKITLECEYTRDLNVAIQSDMNESNPKSSAYIKNRTHYFGDKYYEDLILPGNQELLFELSDAGDGIKLGYALLGQKLNLKAGNTYQYNLEIKQYGKTISSSEVKLTAYLLKDLYSNVPENVANAVCLVSGSGDLFLCSGAAVSDLDDLSTVYATDDTLYMTYSTYTIENIIGLNTGNITAHAVLVGYKDEIKDYNKLDINYLPIDEISKSITKQSLTTTFKYERTYADTPPTVDGSLDSAFKDEKNGYIYRATDIDSTNRTFKLLYVDTNNNFVYHNQVFTCPPGAQMPAVMDYVVFDIFKNRENGGWRIAYLQSIFPMQCAVIKPEGYDVLEIFAKGISRDRDIAQDITSFISINCMNSSFYNDILYNNALSCTGTHYGYIENDDYCGFTTYCHSAYNKTFAWHSILHGTVRFLDNSIIFDGTVGSAPALSAKVPTENTQHCPVYTVCGACVPSSGAQYTSMEDATNIIIITFNTLVGGEITLEWRKSSDL